MDDDFNTADAVSAVFELVKLSNSTACETSSKAYVDYLKDTIARLCDVLGIITERKADALEAEIEEMIAARQQALDMGIILEDTREGVKWKRA